MCVSPLNVFSSSFYSTKLPFTKHKLTTSQPMEEAVEDIVIAGAGLAGLATALGLHRQATPLHNSVISWALAGLVSGNCCPPGSGHGQRPV